MDVVIVGAGHAGLAASQQLTQRDVEHVVLERGRIGESWRSQRWDSFTLNTPSWMNRLPGEGESETADPHDGFISQHELVDRLEFYAEAWELPVRERVRVGRIEHVDELSRFRVYLADDADEPIDCRAVIVASGVQNVPKVPPIGEAMPAHVTQLPALEYRRATQLPPGSVLVVGGGQTGGQVVEDLLNAGRDVYWSVSAVTRVPRRYRGRDILEWLTDAGFYEMTPEQVADPAELTATMPIISGVGRYGHTLSLQWLAGKGAHLLGRITGVDGGRLTLDDSLERCIRFGDERSEEVRTKIDEGITAAGFELPPLEPDDADTPFTDFAALHPPERLDIDAAGIATIIWATGVTGDYDYLPAGATAGGQPSHAHGASPVAGLDYIGLPWLTRRNSGIINGIVRDAELVGQRAANRVRA